MGIEMRVNNPKTSIRLCNDLCNNWAGYSGHVRLFDYVERRVSMTMTPPVVPRFDDDPDDAPVTVVKSTPHVGYRIPGR